MVTMFRIDNLSFAPYTVLLQDGLRGSDNG